MFSLIYLPNNEMKVLAPNTHTTLARGKHTLPLFFPYEGRLYVALSEYYEEVGVFQLTPQETDIEDNTLAIVPKS